MSLGYRSDLYRGTVDDYDAYRRPYPAALLDDLRTRVPVTGQGRLLDLACGTGQLTFALADHFREVVALDREPEFVARVQEKAARSESSHIHARTGAAETEALVGTFELIVIGNAFHRLDRLAVARHVRAHLEPRGGLALVWGYLPWQGGDLPWQHAFSELVSRWTRRASVDTGGPARRDPESHEAVLRRAGLHYVGRFELAVHESWTLDQLIGCAFSVSTSSRRALGAHATDFERDARATLGSGQTFEREADYAYELARSERA